MHAYGHVVVLLVFSHESDHVQDGVKRRGHVVIRPVHVMELRYPPCFLHRDEEVVGIFFLIPRQQFIKIKTEVVNLCLFFYIYNNILKHSKYIYKKKMSVDLRSRAPQSRP